jgi:hypothetical protein
MHRCRNIPPSVRLPDLGLSLTQFRLEGLGIHPGQDLASLNTITILDQDC